MNLNCLLINSDGKLILVDNGLGDKLTAKEARNWALEYPQGTLIESLSALGISTMDINIVINTHLHSDHCGGNTQFSDGRIEVTFPQAEYWVQRLEWADAMHPDLRTRNTYLEGNFRPVWEAGRFRLQHGDTQVTSEVRTVVTRGHTRGHQSVILEGGNESVMFLADLASYSVNMTRTAWVTSYDAEPLENIRSKQIWQAWAVEHDALLIFQHDSHTPLGKPHPTRKID
jgi:glyoxylase-like metal-dependent hydrolase (beta-lactamase superfamily II)